MSALEKTLKELGLSAKEIAVYKLVLLSGSVSASQLGRELSLPRQTVYSLLEKLVAMCAVAQSDREGVRQFSADPEALLALVREKKQRLESDHAALERELPEILASRRRKVRNFPNVQYYEGDDGLKRLFGSILLYYKQSGDKEFRGYGVNKIGAPLAGYLHDFVAKRYKLGVTTKLVIGRGPDDFYERSGGSKLGREVKRLDMDEQNAGVYLVGNRLYLFSYTDNVGVMIENETIIKLLTAVFDAQWSRE